MILDSVTITGADDSVPIAALNDLSAEYPYVEWGILFSQSRQGSPRYPSARWLGMLYDHARPGVRLAAHLCGAWVRDLAAGQRLWFSKHQAARFGRIQLNFSGAEHTVLGQLLPMPWRYVLQCNGESDAWIKPLCTTSATFAPLFDRSGGAGRSPAEWPAPWPGIYCGYAGGLNPDNVAREVERIARPSPFAHVENRVWIDMERGVRSDGDAMFDLSKAHAVLKAVRPYMSQEARI